jgi:hypothetical protein
MANVQNHCPANANACECVQAGIDCELLEQWQTLLWKSVIQCYLSAGDVIVGGDAEGLPPWIIDELSTTEGGDAPEQSRKPP